ncbi:hexokinase [Pisolithus croceorrhizus]|nr:hexokinase [Pisolithus croceorrhizus]KAI6165041.1 hexokinase [Pisolithus thermaeus]
MPQTHAIYAHHGEDILSSVLQQFDVHDDHLFNITRTFLREMWDGLESYGHDMAMIPTFVRSTPDGSEKGTFLALDLGGTNLRVCEVNLHGDKTFSLRQQKYKVSDTLKTGEATTLFDYLADSVDAFLTDSGSPTCALPPSLARRDITEASDSEDVHGPYIPLGLTFSFPVEQTALDSGKLLTWTKGFSAKNAIGNDVVKLLQDAFDRKHMHVRCVALVNDTVGALLSRAYTSGGCILGAIFGTGTNGAYVEDVANISKLGRSEEVKEKGSMVVNTEWGGFNNSRSALPSTPYDNKVDRESINPGKQSFEKFISGMYLGEIARNVIVSLIDAAPKPLLFSGHSSKQLNKQWGVDTAVLSEVEEAWEGIGRFAPEDAGSTAGTGTNNGTDSSKQSSVQQKLERIRDVIVKRMELPPDSVSLDDADIIRKICTHVAWRAARLSSCAVAAVLVQTGRARLTEGEEETKNIATKLVDEGKRIGVGVDGSLVEHYPYFEKKLRASLRVLVGEDVEHRVDIGFAKDGSGVGAALCALVAYRQNLAKQYHTVYEHEATNGLSHSHGPEKSACLDPLVRT